MSRNRVPEEQVTQEMLLHHLEYREGLLYWKIPLARWMGVGDLAGGFRSDGYYCLSIFGKPRLGHRMIWKMFHGYLPPLIDHIDRNPRNNLIENLRPSDKRDNAYNTGMFKHNTSGIKGVSRQGNSWVAAAKVGGKYVRRHFKSKEEAIACRAVLLEKGGQGNGEELLGNL